MASTKGKKIRDNVLGYTFMLPWIIGFLTFTAGPFFYTIYLSFHEVNLTVRGWETVWNNFDNYLSAFLRNTEFIPAMIGFIGYELIYVPVIIVIAFILAMMLNQKIKFRSGFRLIYFLPVIIMSGSVMTQLMNSGNVNLMQDLENLLLLRIIAEYAPILADGLELLLGNFILILWFTGIPIILFLNILQKIDPSVMEAARIDGASSWQILWKITIPVVRPVALTAGIFTIVQIGLFPINPVSELIRDASFNTASGLGVASTLSWLYSVVLLALIGLAFLILRERKEQ